MDLSNILFLDIETVPQYASFDQAPPSYRELWEEKAQYLVRNDEDTAQSIFDRAGIYAEFGRIICISVGHMNERHGSRELRIKSFYGHDEKALLEAFAEMLNKHFNAQHHALCAHNGKEFDFPYISRRMLVNNVRIPRILDLSGKKPWEVCHYDTMQMWKFGDFKSYTSLKLLAHVFGLPTPKDDIDGSMVAGVYWKEQDMERIVRYCEKDVLTLCQVFLRLSQLPALEDFEIYSKQNDQ